ncbi:MAG: PilW family protein [Halioglobus sp.]
MNTSLRSTSLTQRHRVRGFTLIELMISILLGLILSLGIVNVYLGSKRNYAAEEDMARIQENGRYAINFLKRELMQVGFYGGRLDVDEMPAGTVTTDCVAAGNWALDASVPLELINDFNSSLVTKNGTTLSNTCLIVSEIVSGTDIVTVKRTAGEPTLRDGAYTAGVTAAKNTQWYLRVQDYGSQKSWIYNDTAGFNSTDDVPGSKVDYWEFYSQIFYIRNYSLVAGDDIPTLCVERLVASEMTTECLVEGVEDMQLEYGLDNNFDGFPNQFVSDPNTPDIGDAVVAKVYLLLRGTSPIAGYTNTKTYNLGQKVVAAKNDAYLRRVMTTTVQMRNLILPTI